MPSKYYRWTGNEFVELGSEDGSLDAQAPAVHDDTLKAPLQNPVTGEIFDSKTQYLESVRRAGCEVVGNDRVGQKPRRPSDNIDEAKVVDRSLKAEAILSDPARRRAWHNEQLAKYEQKQRLLRGR